METRILHLTPPTEDVSQPQNLEALTMNMALSKTLWESGMNYLGNHGFITVRDSGSSDSRPVFQAQLQVITESLFPVLKFTSCWS